MRFRSRVEPRNDLFSRLKSLETRLSLGLKRARQEEIEKSDEEIRVTAAGSVAAYVSRAATVFNELKKPYARGLGCVLLCFEA